MPAAIPIYIPSKGRAAKPKTADLLADAGLPFTVVVEPQDYDEYEAYRPEYCYHVLEQDNVGYTGVCNAIHVLGCAQGADMPWYWMIDDDIDAFYVAGAGKTTRTDAKTALRGAEGYFREHPSIAMAALEFQQYAWSATNDYVLNTACRAVVCTHTGRTRLLRRRQQVDIKADTDFSMQILAAGYYTVRITKYAFGTGKYGTAQGGQEQAYAVPGVEEACVQSLMRLWPGYVQRVVKKDGRVDARVDWKALAPR